MNQFIVKKLGGENAGELHRSSNNIIGDYKRGNLQAVFVSAIRDDDFNTTDHLIALADYCAAGNIDAAYEEAELIMKFHVQVINREFAKEGLIRERLIKEVTEFFISFNDIITSWYSQENRNIPSAKNDYTISYNNSSLSILGFGEDVSAHCMAITLNAKAQLLNILEDEQQFAKAIYLGDVISPEEASDKEAKEIFELLFARLYEQANKILEDNMIPILPGFVGSFPDGIANAVGRGYTDAASSALAVGYKKNNPGEDVVLEIQKAVQGILSADPRMLRDPSQAKLIEQIDYLTSKEIVGARGAQAKLLNEHALREELLENGIKVHLFNPFDDGDGTWISPEGDQDIEGVSFIGGRKDVYFVSISSAKMGQGFLKKVFQVVARYVSVDIVSTSETEITFTIDGAKEKDRDAVYALVDKLKAQLDMLEDDEFNMEFVEAINSKALVFCSGQNMYNRCGLLARATRALSREGINVEVVSQGRLQRAMVFGIEEVQLKDAVNVLHREFIEKTEADEVVCRINSLLETELLDDSIRNILFLEKERLLALD